MKIPELNKKENHYVKATLNNEKSEIRDVPCKIFLPERIYEKPYLLFKPKNSADATRVMSVLHSTVSFEKLFETDPFFTYPLAFAKMALKRSISFSSFSDFSNISCSGLAWFSCPL